MSNIFEDFENMQYEMEEDSVEESGVVDVTDPDSIFEAVADLMISEAEEIEEGKRCSKDECDEDVEDLDEDVEDLDEDVEDLDEEVEDLEEEVDFSEWDD